MLMTFFTGQREVCSVHGWSSLSCCLFCVAIVVQVQQQLSWLQQQSSGKLPELDQAESSLAKVKEKGPLVKQTAADTLGMCKETLSNNKYTFVNDIDSFLPYLGFVIP